METIALLWNTIIMGPMINSLVVLYDVFFDNFGIAIIILTVAVNLMIMPLTLKQTRQMKQMGSLQPKLREIQQRHPDDPRRRSQETMRLYKQMGVNPLGCFGPLAIQMVVFIGLFYALRQTLPTNPDALVGLSAKLYSWLPMVHGAIPLNSSFLWLDLSIPDRSIAQLVLPVLVGVSTWVQQKMTTPMSSDPRQASTNKMMLWMMPFFLGFITLQFPSGLALYWVTSSLIRILIQYFNTGWAPLFAKAESEPDSAQSQEAAPQPAEEIDSNGDERDIRQNRRRSPRSGSERARRKPRGSRGKNNKPR